MNSDTVRTSSERPMRQARAHSRRVRMLRRALIPAAVAVALTLVGYTALQSFSLVPGLDGDLSFQDGKVVMSRPVLEGQTADDLPYILRAARALQAPTDLERVELEELSGDIPISKSKRMAFETRNARFDSDEQILTFEEHMVLTTTDNERVELTEGTLDIQRGRFDSNAAISVDTPTSSLSADRGEYRRNDDVFQFSGNVRITIKPKNRTRSSLPGSDIADAEEPVDGTDTEQNNSSEPQAFLR